MTAMILDGKKISQEIQEQITQTVQHRKEKGLAIPGLAVVLVGENPASKIYVKNKRQACEKTGIYSKIIDLRSDTSETELLRIIDKLNKDSKIHGILVQLPLPELVNQQSIIEAIDPRKDVDGFHPYNLGRLLQKNPLLRPCTPYGIIKLLESTGEVLEGKDAIVVGASNIVGRPMALELLLKRCTVMICHSKTKNLPDKVKQSDIIIATVGIPQFVKRDWVKNGAIVIDVGINRLETGRIVGDVEFETVKEQAGWITPVPGGVGPMTIATLLINTLKATEKTD
jgi:methylenetetrahydrofolate dehydrogenase (NADP+)/methenyltetrahydrofolate cyclohydrolase